MTRFVASSALLAVAALALAGCVPTEPQPSASPTEHLDATGSWTLVSATDANGALPMDLTDIVVAIDGGQIGGSVCNSWGGDFAVTGSTVVIGPLASTEMYCTEPDGIMDLEARFLADLALVTNAAIDDSGLYLSGANIEFAFAHVQ